MASITDLKPDPRNARRRTDRSASLIVKSLEQFGAARSIVIDEDGRVLAGNGTLEGAKAAGISKLRIVEADGTELIAVRRTGLTEEQKVGLAIADNRSSDLSEWDGEMLQELAADQDLGDWFEEGELRCLLSNNDLEDGVDATAGNEQIDDADTQVVVGSYRFALERNAYMQWRDAIRDRVGFEEDDIKEEIRRRLQIPA